jgi:hypothetical protein
MSRDSERDLLFSRSDFLEKNIFSISSDLSAHLSFVRIKLKKNPFNFKENLATSLTKGRDKTILKLTLIIMLTSFFVDKRESVTNLKLERGFIKPLPSDQLKHNSLTKVH